MAAQDNEERRIEPADGGAPELTLAAVRRQAAWLVAALGAGAAALYFHYVEELAEWMQPRLAAESPWLPPLVVALGMIVICWLRDRFFPGTEGTGIPQAIAALRMKDGPARWRVLSPRIAIGKTLLLTLGLCCGATIGREGPSVHVAACLLFLATRGADFPRNFVERGLILAGGAAGIGAAFNTPLAAIVFAFEEIGRSFEKSNAGVIVRTTIVACLLGWMRLSDYLFYGRVETQLDGAADWLVVVVVGLAGGLLGGAFARVVIAGAAAVRRLNRWNPYVAPVGLGLALAVIGVLSAGQSYGGGYLQARAILIEGAELPVWYPLAKAAGLFVSLISGIPGGLFDPSLSVGAALAQIFWPWSPSIERQAFILLAMGGYFAGVVQSPITAAVILVEMTGAGVMILPLLATTTIAYEASRLVCRPSLYEALALVFLGDRGET